MKSLKPAAAVSAIAASALLLAGCSAGHITQTSEQVAAVDGASAISDNEEVAVHDVTVVLDSEGQSALKFTAINQNTKREPHILQSVTVDGTPVQLNGSTTIASECSLVADSAEALEAMPKSDSNCIEYVTTSLPNKNFAYAGNVPVQFKFDVATVDVTATISAPTVQSGQSERGEAHK